MNSLMNFKETRMKKRMDKRGFTLVEIVIVIVILAILAALLVPSLLAWIDSAREKTVQSEADTIRKALTVQLWDMHGNGKNVDGNQNSAVYDTAFWNDISYQVNKKLQCTDPSADGYVTFEIENTYIKTFTYKSGKFTAKLENDKWVVEE